jgi:serine/threonine-protein kinase
VALAVFLAVGLAAGYTGWWLAAGRYGRVPNVVGQSESAAVAKLRSAGYQVSSRSTTQFSETIQPGDVISTSPAVGSRLPHGRTISLVLSKGKERFTVPSVANDSLTAARAALAKIPVQVVAQPVLQSNDTVPKGKVIGTNPSAGSLVKRSQAVTIIVSSGPPIITIPPVGPNTSASAEESLLHKLGFKTTEAQANSTSVDKGDVISLSPSGSAPKFSTITVTVSLGPPIVTVPDISAGTPLSDAEATLQRVGLNYTVRRFSPDANAVLTISPGGGTQVRQGSTVVIYAI